MKLLTSSLVLALVTTQTGTAQTGAAPASGALLPILDVESGYVLGGSRGGKWIEAKIVASDLKIGSTHRVFSATRGLEKAKLTKLITGEAPCPDTFFSDVSPNPAKQKAQFALGGAHNPLPRAFLTESNSQATYRNIVAAILRKNGIAKPVVQITQIWRTDLDGDGTQEVLLTATRKGDYGDPTRIQPNSRAGDYSLLLLRKLVAAKAQNILLEGEFYPRAKDFNAPGFYRLAAVLDADGDGKMEILVRGNYYEGQWTSLYSAQGAKPRAVLSEGCGA